MTVNPQPFESDVPSPRGRAHHVGVTVESIEVSLSFWQSLLGIEPVWRGFLDAPHIARITGYENVSIDVAWLPLNTETILELVEYHLPPEHRQPAHVATARPGSVHIGLSTDDIAGLWQRAIDNGAEPISASPIPVVGGPADGARVAYLRDPAGVVFEIMQPSEGLAVR